MGKNKVGKIINIAFMLYYQNGIFVLGYTALKHAVAILTKAFSNELAKIKAIFPGYIISDNTKLIRKDRARKDAVLARISAQKWEKTEGIVCVFLFLSSPASNYVHRKIIYVDEGWQER